MSTSGDFDSETNNSAGGISFWDVKQYTKTLRRLENANKLCTDICNMIQDRVDLEKSYASNLKKWSSKWSSYLENGPEYGTTKQCWLGFCREADSLSEIHKEIRSRLVDEVQSEVRNWQREHYHKATLPPQNLKEVKSLESDFESAQKAWAKKLKKANQSKKDFHQQCKMARSYEVQNKNAANDSSISQEQLKKIEEKLKKTEKDMDKSKSQYENCLQDLETDSPRYVEEMTKVFQKAQDMEKERMEFFKTVFQRIQQILNLSQNVRLSEIYSEFDLTNTALDPDADITFWSTMYGSDMPFHPPQFEYTLEYTADLHSITKKKPTSPSESVTLTAINPTSRQGSIRSGGGGASPAPSATDNTVSSYSLPPSRIHNRPAAISISSGNGGNGLDTSPISPPMDPASPSSNATSRCNGEDNEYDDNADDSEPCEAPAKPRRSIVSSPITPTNVTNETGDCNFVNNDESFDQNDIHSFDTEANKESPTHENGVPVRALYDYTGVEEDELTLKQGDVFYKLEDEDEQGWCKGRKNGSIGLYPANYAEEID